MTIPTSSPATSPSDHHGLAPAWRWARRHLFPTPFHALLSVATLAMVAWFLFVALDWLVFSATFVGDSQADCTGGGACWLPITQRIDLFVYGFY
ncbi:hypothetical protein R5R73_18060 [Salinicola sp. LHM]|uniref:hypothetical protein n=1 Tax=Salinicola sp. LHM TaxID=3065298 RepID=UPI002ACDDF31|nr:hypothetical protein [Salinicola sp. LHM]WQH32898.1 hypothetical protein R5R73_18060 [Salinicola sp. LHM]